jgi:hypothetical protein
MKKTIITILMTLFLTTVFAQNENNTFMTYSEFRENIPSKFCDFKFKHRTTGNVFMTGGITNYRLKKIKPETKTEEMTKVVWGIVVKDTVYINSYLYSKLIGYNKIIEKGYYSYFIGEPARFLEEQIKLGIINEGDKQISVCCKSGYVILPDGQIKILKPEIMETLLKENKSLIDEFISKNLKQENVYEMFEFLHRFNQTIK